MTGFFSQCRLHISGIDFVLPSEVPSFLDKGACLVDLRTEFETEIKSFGVDRIFYLPFDEMEDKIALLSPQIPLIFADAVGLHSKEAVMKLKARGFIDIASLAGGIADWEKDGMPMKKGRYQPLNGPCPCMIKPREKQ